jgi:hypothetical protein
MFNANTGRPMWQLPIKRTLTQILPRLLLVCVAYTVLRRFF